MAEADDVLIRSCLSRPRRQTAGRGVESFLTLQQVESVDSSHDRDQKNGRLAACRCVRAVERDRTRSCVGSG